MGKISGKIYGEADVPKRAISGRQTLSRTADKGYDHSIKAHSEKPLLAI